MTDFAERRTTMVDTQVRPSDVTKFPIIQAMLSIPRETFVPQEKREAAYVETMIDQGSGRMLMEPRTFAKLLDAMDLQNTDLVLDIGSGLGYSAAIIASMVEAVVALESEEPLLEDAQTALAETDVLNVVPHVGALHEGAAEHGPYDAIFIQGGVEAVPDALAAQLKEGGRIAAIFMDGAHGEACVGHKIDGTLHWRLSFNASAPVLPGFEKPRAFNL